MLFGSWDVLTCVSTSKVPTPEKVPTSADTCRCRHVPTPVISLLWTILGYWDVLANASTWKGADTWEGADTCRCWHVSTHVGAVTCRHLWYQSYGLYLVTGMYWQMPAPGKVPTHRKVPTRAGMCQHIKVPAQVPTYLRAGTSMCRHVLTYECYLKAGMCWHVSAPRRCRQLRRYRHL